jgi:TRAP-type C4-dicarboxylate transport system substrate-binding protein
MTVVTKFMTLLAGAAIATLGAGGAVAQDVTLRLHQFLPAQANVPKLILDVWADRIEAQSGGRIKIDRFPSMQLGGSPPDLIDQAMDGVADIVWTVVGYTPGRFPTTEVFELPFFVEDPRAASCAYWKMFETHMKDAEFRDLKVLGTWVHGPGMLHTSDPVETLEDLRGMKIRGASRQVNRLLDRVGATPVGLPVPAVPEGLSKGVIDGAAIPWEVTTALKVPDLVEFHTEFAGAGLYNLTFVLAMNKERYSGLPDDLKAVIDAASGLEFSIFSGGTQADADEPARQIAVDNGNEIITITDPQDWYAAAQPVYADWVADMNALGLDGQARIDEARALMDGPCKGVTSAY